MPRSIFDSVQFAAALLAVACTGVSCQRKTVHRTPEAVAQLRHDRSVRAHDPLSEPPTEVDAAPFASGTGRVVSIDPTAGRVIIAHEPPVGDDWPSVQISLKAHPSRFPKGLSPGDRVWFHVERREGAPEVVQLQKLSAKKAEP